MSATRQRKPTRTRLQKRSRQNASPTEDGTKKLGTFGGVFAPSLLTILGLVLFLRLGFVTGNVGLVKMLAILAVSTSVSLVTTISLAAIATNLKVGGGGVYFLISRTLGPAFGGAIGIVLYVAMSLSIAFYAIGLGEALSSVLGTTQASMPRIIAAITVLGLLALAWLGADIATRLQYVVMACLLVAIAAYFLGVADHLRVGNLSESLWTPTGGGSFWVSFAIFFPAITGFTQGVAMSGDLRTPSRSISIGTFGAIGVSTVVYLLVIFTFALAVSLEDLREDTAIMRRLSLAPWFIDVGVIAATLSSAIASMMGAPRTLQRLAADRLVKPLEPFAEGAGPDNNPRRGSLLSGAIALAAIALGDLDLVAPIISMFFLASYGMINFATYSEARAASTSFRPRFKLFDWRLSLLGTAGCLGVILAIDPVSGAAAGAAVFGLYRYLQRSVQQVRWADSTRGFHTSQVRTHLRLMGPQTESGRDWRPFTVAFAPRDPERRRRLSEVAHWIEGGAGFSTLVRIVPGSGAMNRKRAARIALELQRELAESGDKLYGRVIAAETIAAGVGTVLQSHGVGALRPNLALYSADELDVATDKQTADFATILQTAARHDCHVAVAHCPDHGWERLAASPKQQSEIVVWWQDNTSGKLLTLLAWMCTRSTGWSNASITVWIVAESDAAKEVHAVNELLDGARITAHVAGVAPASDFAVTVRDADLVFAPMRIRQNGVFGPGGETLGVICRDLPLAVFATAAVPVELDVQPDDSTSAALAAARDRSDELLTRANELSENAGTLIVTAEMLRMTAGDDPALVAHADEAAALATKAQRKYLDARTRADKAVKLVESIDPSLASGAIDEDHWLTD